ncbi:ABC transporter ATP-binding protein [Hoeflea sp.]|uniref:ABC transporter ATP-binding protein n=1 Tax=Hoeflea sp. TaxID=1940281 RepID=UPI003B527093
MTDDSRPLLKIENLSKSFGSLAAVSEVSVSVNPGEIIGIAGPNGAGKTTLFNLVSRIPFGADSGTVMFDGQRIDDLPPHEIFRAGLARTFQKETSFGKLTVEQNIRLGAVFGGRVSKSEISHAVDRALDVLDLAQLRKEKADNLPVYETKRLMIASAIVNKPKLLMLDEPASGLNSVELADLKKEILRLKELGLAILLIEHILPLLFGVSERVMVMDFGKKLTEGPPELIAKNPKVIEAYLGGQGQEAANALVG